MIFETERLEVKKLSIDDLGDFHRLHSDHEIMSKIPAPTSTLEESTAKLVSTIDAYQIERHRLRVWGVYLKTTQQFVGLCASIRVSDSCRDIGYRLLKEHWGQGMGTEVTAGLIHHLRQDISIKSLVASVDVNNIASIKILDKYMKVVPESESDEEGDEIHYHLSL